MLKDQRSLLSDVRAALSTCFVPYATVEEHDIGDNEGKTAKWASRPTEKLLKSLSEWLVPYHVFNTMTKRTVSFEIFLLND